MGRSRTAVKSTLLVNQLCSLAAAPHGHLPSCSPVTVEDWRNGGPPPPARGRHGGGSTRAGGAAGAASAVAPGHAPDAPPHPGHAFRVPASRGSARSPTTALIGTREPRQPSTSSNTARPTRNTP